MAIVVVVRVSKLVVNLRKVSNRAHPSSFLSTPFLLLINHHDRNAAYTLGEEVNCNYQSLSLLGPTLLFSPSTRPSRLVFLDSVVSLSFPYRPTTWKFHPPVIISPPRTQPHAAVTVVFGDQKSPRGEMRVDEIFRYVANLVKLYCPIL